MTLEQRAAWGHSGKCYCKVAAESQGYVRRLLPYLVRILALSIVAGAPHAWISGNSALMFLTWYPTGVLVVASASMPWSKMFAKQ